LGDKKGENTESDRVLELMPRHEMSEKTNCEHLAVAWTSRDFHGTLLLSFSCWRDAIKWMWC